MTVQLLYYRNTNLVELRKLRSASSSTYLNGATVTMVLTPRGSTSPVAGAGSTGALAFTRYSTLGDFRCAIPSTAGVLRSGEYMARVTVDGGASLQGYWELPLISRARST